MAMATDALRPEIASAVVQAVSALQTFISERGKDLGYVSKYQVPLFRENEHGWPATVAPAYQGDNAVSFRRWYSSVGVTRAGPTHITPQDVPELADAVACVLADRPFAERLAWFAEHAKDEESREKALTEGAIELVTDVLERAEALGESDAAALRGIYLEREAAVISEELRADLLFPLALVHLELDEALLIGDRMSIEPLDEPTQRARATSSYGVDEVNPYLVAAATHAIVMHDVVVSNSDGPTSRQVRMMADPPGIADADQVCQVLAILSGKDVGYAQVVLRPIGWADRWKGDLPPNQNLGTVRRFPFDMIDRGWLRPGATISADALSDLPTGMERLTSASQRGQLAARRLAQSALREVDEDALLDACIGLEALLGDGRDELSHRMGLRAATALAPDADPQRVYTMLKRVYEHRSRIVHGSEPKHPYIEVDAKKFTPAAVATFLLRQLLRSYLAVSTPWSPPDLDAKLLSSLAVPPTADMTETPN